MMVVGVVIGEIVTMGFDEGQRAGLSVGRGWEAMRSFSRKKKRKTNSKSTKN